MEGGLLQAFYLMFKANADEAEAELDRVEKAANDAGKAASKATDEFGKIGDKAPPGLKKAEQAAKGLKTELQSTQQVSQSLSSSFLSFAKGLAGPLLAGFSVAGISNIVKTRAAEIDAVSKAADRAGTKIGNFEALTRTARNYGGDIKAAEGNLESFRKNIGDALINPKGQQTKIFSALGISLKTLKKDASDTTDVLLRVAGAVEKMDRDKAEAYIRKLGITDKGLQTSIMEGKKRLLEFIETEKELGVTTEDQVRIVNEYMSTWDSFGDVMKRAGNSIMEAVLPAFTAVVRGVSHAVNYLVKHKTLVIGFFVGVAGAITAVYLPAILSAVAATIALLAPYLAIAAAVAAVGVAFALAYEDVMFFLNGQPSLIGDLVSKYEWAAKAVRGIGRAWQWVKDVATVVGDELGSVWENQSKMNDQSVKDIEAAWAWLKTTFAPVANEIKRDFSSLWDGVQSDWSNFVGEFNRDVETWKSVLKTVSDWAKERWAEVVQSFSEAGPAIMAELNQLATDISSAVAKAGDALYDGFNSALEKVKGLWSGFKAWVIDIINSIKNAAIDLLPSMPKFSGWGSGDARTQLNAWQTGLPGGAGNGPLPITGQSVRAATNANLVVGDSPFNSRDGATAATGPSNVDARRETNVTTNVGGVTINTTASDASGIAAGLDGAMQDRFRATASSFDDGVRK